MLEKLCADGYASPRREQVSAVLSEPLRPHRLNLACIGLVRFGVAVMPPPVFRLERDWVCCSFGGQGHQPAASRRMQETGRNDDSGARRNAPSRGVELDPIDLSVLWSVEDMLLKVCPLRLRFPCLPRGQSGLLTTGEVALEKTSPSRTPPVEDGVWKRLG